jgi:hypothetical protein
MRARADEDALAALTFHFLGWSRGTVAGGDITVCALPPASGVAASAANR